MVEIALIVVLVTSIWAGVDAHGRGRGGIGWFLGCILLWIVCFPVYLAVRNRPEGPRSSESPGRFFGESERAFRERQGSGG